MTKLSERISTALSLFDLAKAVATRRGEPFDPSSGGSGFRASLRSFEVDYWKLDGLDVVEVRPRQNDVSPLRPLQNGDKLFSARKRRDEFLITTFQRGAWESQFLDQARPRPKP